jgi:iron complex outermembrane receptor protein
MNWPGQLGWLGLLLTGHLVALPQLPTRTVFGQTEAEATGLTSSRIIAPVSSHATGLREALEKVPGLVVQDSFGGIEPPRLSVRGSGTQSAPVSRGVRLQLDGFPLGFADGSFNTGLVESAWLDHAQLSPGPAAGVPALGGDLSLWSTLIEPINGGAARASIGPHNSHSLAAWQGNSDNGHQLAAGFSARRTDGWRNYNKQQRETVIASVNLPLGTSERWQLDAHLFAARPRIEIPGPLTRSQALKNPQSVSPAIQRDQPYRKSEYLRLGNRLSLQSSEGHFSIGASGALYKDSFRLLLPNGISNTSAREAALFIDLGRDWDGPWEQRTKAHLCWQHGWRKSTRDRNAEGSAGPRIGDNRLRPDTWTLTLDHTLDPSPTWRLEVGASLLHARRKIQERFETTASRPSTALDLADTHIAPRIAISWLPSAHFQASLGLARSYEPPTFDDLLFTTGPMPARELASAPLEWQRADQIELAIQGGGSQWTWRIAAYEAYWQREFLRLLDDQGNPRGTVNADKTRRRGLEVYMDRYFYDAEPLSLRAWTNAHWIDFRFDEDPVLGNNRIAGQAPFSGTLGLEATTANGWFVAPSVRGQSGRLYVDHANTLTIPSFAVWTLDAGRRHPSGWSVHLRIENLFNKRYIASPAGVLDSAAPNAPVFLPGASRRWQLGLEYTW